MKKILLTVFILNTLFPLPAFTQELSNKETAAEANEIATGNYKDIFNSFFQLAIDRLTSDTKELNFTTNPFAVMAKMDSNLYRDDNYFHYRHLRKLNISVAGKLDSNYKFNGFSAGIKYALVNKRDETVSRAFLADVLHDSLMMELTQINTEMAKFIATLQGIEKQKKVNGDFKKFTKGEAGFDELDSELQEFIKTIIAEKKLTHLENEIDSDPGFNFYENARDIYDKIKKSYNNKLLWTAGIHDTTYNDEFMFSNIVFSSELVKGVIKPSAACNMEINLLSTLQLTDDTLIAGRDLSRTVFNFEPGLNLVLKGAQSDKSYLEFKLSGAYWHIFSKLYMNEKRDNLTMNGTLRIRVLNDIWVPLEIKYDPETGNLFGFLTLKANFTGLGNLLGR